MEKEQGQRRARTPAQAAAAHAPYIPTPWEAADVLSIQSVRAGTATMVEQKRAFEWVMRCTGYLDEPYRPGDDAGRRDTDFALGKANVGRQIAKLLNMDLSRLKGGEREHG